MTDRTSSGPERDERRAHQAVPDDLLEIACAAAEAAGAILRARFGRTVQQAVKSSPTDPVTEADRAAEAAIVFALREQRPDDSIVGEEGASVEGVSPIRWVIDPLDGTVNYLFGSREWSVSIAACDDQGSLVGVVLDVLGEHRFHAIRGRGAWCDDEPLACRPATDLEHALVLIGLDYSATRRTEQLQEFAALAPQVRDFRRNGSAALELCRVAAGQADAYVEAPIRTWDISAGALIAREAGADVRIVNLGGHERGIVASIPSITNELIGALAASPHGKYLFHRFDEADREELEIIR